MGTVTVTKIDPRRSYYHNYFTSGSFADLPATGPTYTRFEIETNDTLAALDRTWNDYVKLNGRIPAMLLVSPRFYHRCVAVMEDDRRYQTHHAADCVSDKFDQLTFRGARFIVVALQQFDYPIAVGATQHELNDPAYWFSKDSTKDSQQIVTVDWGL